MQLMIGESRETCTAKNTVPTLKHTGLRIMQTQFVLNWKSHHSWMNPVDNYKVFYSLVLTSCHNKACTSMHQCFQYISRTHNGTSIIVTSYFWYFFASSLCQTVFYLKDLRSHLHYIEFKTETQQKYNILLITADSSLHKFISLSIKIIHRQSAFIIYIYYIVWQPNVSYFLFFCIYRQSCAPSPLIAITYIKIDFMCLDLRLCAFADVSSKLKPLHTALVMLILAQSAHHNADDMFYTPLATLRLQHWQQGLNSDTSVQNTHIVHDHSECYSWQTYSTHCFHDVKFT